MVLAMALALPMAAYAAADVSVRGELSFRAALGEDSDPDTNAYRLQGNWRTRAYLDFTTSRGAASFYARYRARTADWAKFGEGSFSGSAVFVDLLDAYVDFKGPVIKGVAEDLQIRVGRWDDNVGNWAGDVGRWIGDIPRYDGVLARFGVGPASVGLYHAWVNANERIVAASARATVDIVELSGAYVGWSTLSSSVPSDERSNADFAVAATVKPADGITVTAEYAVNGERKEVAHPTSTSPGAVQIDWGDQASAWKVSGTLATIPNLTLRASVWSTDDDFRPVYRQLASQESLDFDRTWTYGESRSGSSWGDPWMKTGFSIGASTTQAGLPIDVSFKSGKIFEDNLPGWVEMGLQAIHEQGVDVRAWRPDYSSYLGKSMYVVGVGTTIAQVRTNLTYSSIEDHKPVIDLTASRALPVDVLGGNVTLKGTVRFVEDRDTAYAVDATWSAPNGLYLGAHYANYDRVLDWGHNNSADNYWEGVDVGVPGKADGFAITAGYNLSF